MITHGAFKQRDDTEEQRPLLWQSVLKSMMVTATLLFLLCGCTAGYACDRTGGYRMYRNWRQGAADWYQLIATVYLPEGRVTVASIIPKYAPSADHNDEQAYINSVLRDVSRYQQGEI